MKYFATIVLAVMVTALITVRAQTGVTPTFYSGSRSGAWSSSTINDGEAALMDVGVDGANVNDPCSVSTNRQDESEAYVAFANMTSFGAATVTIVNHSGQQMNLSQTQAKVLCAHY